VLFGPGRKNKNYLMGRKVKILLLTVLALAALLRIVHLDRIPVSLYSDEVDVGYQAYSIMKTGRDYFGNLLPLHAQSYADSRTPLYLYSTIPFVSVFGISAWGVRLTAAIFGVLGVFGMYLLVGQMLRMKKIDKFYSDYLPLVSAVLLAISPWHIQYSRMGFEVSLLLFLIIYGLYFFYKSLSEGKYLPISAVFIILTPLVYSTAKLFIPFLLITLFLLYKEKILRINKKYIISALVIATLLGTISLHATLNSGGGQRFSYISVFTDPVTKPEVDYARLLDAQMRGDGPSAIISKLGTRVVHNKLTFWGERIANNYLTAASFDFLFNNGDPNLRHSINGMGQFYRIEAVFLLVGIVTFFSGFGNRKVKWLIAAWVVFGILPSAVTRDGGNHATRLIIVLIPFIFLIAYGILFSLNSLKGKGRKTLIVLTLLFYVFFFYQYLHLYGLHNPRYSERRWSYGFREIAQYIKENESKYDKIIITNADEQPYILFAGWYGYDPAEWQKGFDRKYVEGFGEISHIDKFYFGQYEADWEIFWKIIDEKTLYIAASREIKFNLADNPNLKPANVILQKSINYPSGDPAFYIFSKKQTTE
jgi:4-amino-4-deoxy-L-arabinose transferase-like glycosyltransferase